MFDTALAAYLLDATAGSYSLDRLCVKYGGFQIGRASDVAAGEQLSLLDAAKWDQAKRRGDYAAEAAAVAALREVMEPRLKEENLWELYTTAELPLCGALAEMERNGCLVDRDALAAFGEMLTRRIAEREAAVYDLAGETFNLNSPKQLGEVLFDKLGLPFDHLGFVDAVGHRVGYDYIAVVMVGLNAGVGA